MAYEAKWYEIDKMTGEEMKKIIQSVPEVEPITGLKRCDDYMFNEGPVYVTEPAYDAYTVPVYDPDWKEFNWVKIDMDDDFRREDSCIDLEELLANGWTIDELEKIYGIKIR